MERNRERVEEETGKREKVAHSPYMADMDGRLTGQSQYMDRHNQGIVREQDTREPPGK
jgi:hypothetical protein